MKLLIVEDDTDINQMIYQYLVKHHYEVVQAYSGTEALLQCQGNHFDLMVIDLMLPGKSGEEVIKEVRKSNDIPMIVLSAKDSLSSKVDVLSSGADDYICKPFELEELLVRIQVQLRKRNHKEAKPLIYQNLKLDPNTYSMSIQGEKISLTKHEYLILEQLIQHPDRVYTKQEIYEYAWNDTYYGDERTINTHISNIRSKIRKYDTKDYIQTVWGIGFKMFES
ncbi:response regulator transcription factor [[Eubacterium] hominis]|uniref:response regulator transcription factor n=1 Tax=[Eubacterium] hominis TaxID=2764325 RepID=UPI003A4D5C07